MDKDQKAVSDSFVGGPRRDGVSRRTVLKSGGVASVVALLSAPALMLGGVRFAAAASPAPTTPVALNVNGNLRRIAIDPRATLLDALREHLRLTGSKKGCDHGQCGACTVLINGRRINACLTLAVMHEEDEITTIEGLAKDGGLHPLQAAFIAHDGFQCGYCTPGQICSAAGMLQEAAAGWPSYVSVDVAVERFGLTDQEIRERMSGNICRCAAYPNIVAAIRQAAQEASL